MSEPKASASSSRRRTLRIVNGVFLILGVIGLAVLVWRTGIGRIADGLASVGLFFPLACAAHLGAIASDALMLQACAGWRGSYPHFLRASLAGHGINEATPFAKLGELTKYSLLAEELPPARAAAALIVQNITMFVTGCAAIAVSCAIGLTVFTVKGDLAVALIAVSGSFAAIAIVALIVMRVGIGQWPFAVLARLGVAGERIARWEASWLSVDSCWREAISDRRAMAANWSAAIFSRCLGVAEGAIILYALGAGSDASMWAAAALSSASFQLILWATSFVPMQVGTHEAGAYALFAAVGMPAHLGLLLELVRKMRRLVFVGVAVLVLGAAAFRGIVSSKPAVREVA